MSYQVLARKYRPQTFQEIVGQEAVVQTLQNAVSSGRLAHAYLFYGPRGVGKTTAARILAKSLNCRQGLTPTPCARCVSCEEIARGNSLDTLEMDAASHTGVDHVREAIIQTVALAPARDRYKIFIVDEVHMLSASAFNALLKTLEEPPAHVVFILATTEVHKIPATIFSRCQRFQFRPLVPEQMERLLEQVLHREKVQAEGGALGFIARAAGGSLRDALSILDQALSFSEGRLTQVQVQELLGVLPQELVQGLVQAILRRASDAVWKSLATMEEEGVDPLRLAQEARDAIRQLFLESMGLTGDPSEAGEKDLAASASPRAYLFVLRRLTRCLEEMRHSASPRLALELTLFHLIQDPVDLDQILARLESLASQSSQATSPSNDSESAADTSAAVRPAPRKTSAPPSASWDAGELWRRFLKQVRSPRPALADYLESASYRVSPDGSQWTICFSNAFHLTGVKRHEAWMLEVLSKLTERPVILHLESGPGEEPAGHRSSAKGASTLGPSGAPAGPHSSAQGAAQELGEVIEEDSWAPLEERAPLDPEVEKVLKIFPGEVRRSSSETGEQR
ncbi:MAG: DNA polymerase III subunit gamma/tau [Elusimicrobia bacterium]|nr:DNA polymerase III subunit gamma/tau [Elusimicrobiota bacterium]